MMLSSGLRLLLPACLVLTGAAFGIWLAGASLGATVYVDDSYAADNASARQWTTVSKGVLDAAPGDTVLVYNGTYNETVTLSNASVTLQGESRVGVTINGPQFGSSPVITVSADGVMIQNLSLSGSANGVAATSSAASNGTLDNVSVLNARYECILIQRASNWTIHDSMARDCGQVGGDGISLIGPGGGHRLRSVLFNRTNGISFGVHSLDDVASTDLIFSSAGGTPVWLENASNVRISGFTVSTGILSGGAIRLTAGTHACSFADGTISATGTWALQVLDSYECRLDNITVPSGSYGGVNFLGGSPHWTWRDVRINLTSRAILFNRTLPANIVDFEHDIDLSNEIAGVPIVYFANASGTAYTGAASFFAAVNSTGLAVSFTSALGRAAGGALILATTSSSFWGLNSSANPWNVILQGSHRNTFFALNQTNTGAASELGGIVLYGSSNNTFEGGHWDNAARAGLAFDARNWTGSSGNRLLNLSCLGWGTCFYFGSGSEGTLVWNAAVSGSDTGVYARDSGSIVVGASRFDSLGSYGLYIRGPALNAASGALVHDSTFNGSAGSSAVYVYAHNTTRVENCTFDFVGNGVVMDGTDGGAVVDSTFYHASGVAIGGYGRGVLLQNLTIVQAGLASVNLYGTGWTLRSLALGNASIPISIGTHFDYGLQLLNDIDLSNTINGVPILWLTNQTSGSWTGNYSWIVIANSSNVTVHASGVQSGLEAGVYLVGTNDSVIDGAVSRENRLGMVVAVSNRNTISNASFVGNTGDSVNFYASSFNTVTGSRLRPGPGPSMYGFVLDLYSYNDTLDSSDCALFLYCAQTWLFTGYLRITNSTISDTRVGIRSTTPFGPTITGNTFVNASDQAILVGPASYGVIQAAHISNNTFRGGTGVSIYCLYCDDAEISDNVIMNGTYGIVIEAGSIPNVGRETIARNNISSATMACIAGYGVDKVKALNNTLSGCQDSGIDMRRSRFWTMRGNVFSDQRAPLYLETLDPYELSYLTHDVDASNIANGFPIRYWINASGLSFNGTAGLVIAVSCTNLNVTFTSTIQLAWAAVLLFFTNDSLFSDLNGQKNLYGIFAAYSNNNTFRNFTLNASLYGSQISDSRNNRLTTGTISGENISSTIGLFLFGTNQHVDSVNFSTLSAGIYMSATNSTVRDSGFSGCNFSVYLSGGTGNALINLSIRDSLTAGIYLAYETGTRVLNSTLVNTSAGAAMRLVSATGILLWGNRIDGAVNGVLFTSSTSNIVVENNFSKVTVRLLNYSSDSSGNLAYHNNFYAGSVLVLDLSPGNFFDNGYPAGGNFWSSLVAVDLYGGPAQNVNGSDGFADLRLAVASSDYDNFPLVEAWPPHVRLSSPPQGSLVGPLSTIRFDISALFDSVRYSINNGTLQNFPGRWNASAVGASDGDLFVLVVATDPWFNLTRSFFFTFDGTRPAVAAITAPNGSVIVAGTQILFNLSDNHLAGNATWSLGAGATAFLAPFSIDTANWTEGVYTVTITAWDLAGNSQTAKFSYIVDPSAPVIAVPGWAGGYYDSGARLTLSASDPLLAWLSWSSDASAGGNVSGRNTTVDTVGWPEGPHVVHVAAGDLGGHITRANFSFTTDSIPVLVIWLRPAAGAVIRPGTWLEFNASDENMDQVSWNLDGGPMTPLNGSYLLDTALWSDGLRNVTVTAVDRAGHVTNSSLVLTLDGTPPSLPFLPATKTDEIGATVVYDASAAVDPAGPLPDTAFEWTFGSGAQLVTRSGPVASIVWSVVGVFDARVTVRDGLGNANTTSITVRVVDTTPPQASFMVPVRINEGETARFGATGILDNDPLNATNASVTWRFDYDGSARTLTGAEVFFLFAVRGDYRIAGTVTDAHGNANTARFDLHVNDIPSIRAAPPTFLRLPGMYDAPLNVVDEDKGDLENVTVTSPVGMTVGGAGSNRTLHFAPGAVGSYGVVIAISDGWSTFHLNFTLKVTLNSRPVFLSGLPDLLRVQVGGNATVPLTPNVMDADDGENLTFTVTSSDPSVVAAVVGNPLDGFSLIVTGQSAGRSTLTLTVTDPYGARSNKTIDVDVASPQNGGEAPALQNFVFLVGIAVAVAAVGVLLWRSRTARK